MRIRLTQLDILMSNEEEDNSEEEKKFIHTATSRAAQPCPAKTNNIHKTNRGTERERLKIERRNIQIL